MTDDQRLFAFTVEGLDKVDEVLLMGWSTARGVELRDVDSKITDADIMANALDFAYGNAAMENPAITREMIESAADDALAIVRTLPTAAELSRA